MKILVCISHVPDTTSKINFTDNNSAFDTTGVQYVINPYDEFALSRAMWFKEKQGATVTVITVGNATTEPTLRKCLAIGADDAIRINTEALDGFQVAKELAEVAKANAYDLILTGRESIDYNGAMVPGMLAALLDFNFINACVGVEIESGAVTASKEIDGGTETLATTLPAVIAGQKGLVEEKDLRIPNMRGIMMARKKPLAIVEPQTIEVATKAINFEKPAEKSACKLVDASNIDGLIDLLHNEAKVI
ncbi:electron transfer flavoprotein subunit beta/FixA family protein [Flavicella sediminum]|uniref:electron transfer flavoprotein subunit beta/FixA family protein n=1 Tax=Flavicella sediminum TaxID=2585141 RepID=UPI001123463C|nr:electron transfer flavoprotein subunit beta/FixA family protein [Flavicella sediminum]